MKSSVFTFFTYLYLVWQVQKTAGSQWPVQKTSSIPSDSPWRGCAANFPQPVDPSGPQELVETVFDVNCAEEGAPLAHIVYRNSTSEVDIRRPVFRWDYTPYDVVFRDGFHARERADTLEEDYYNLLRFVNNAGRPLDSRRDTPYAFVSTTLSNTWQPVPPDDRVVYRYEIYAPGGIWIARTLGQSYRFPSQDEVSFVAGIAPQYIRSAQGFRRSSTRGRRRTTRVEPVNNELIYNANFDPQTHPPRPVDILDPVVDQLGAAGTGESMVVRQWPPQPKAVGGFTYPREWTIINWYSRDVANIERYNIDAAFRSSRRNEAYLFMSNEYLLMNYAPGSKDDRVVNGPHLICEGYPSLQDTPFGEYAVDCAFASHRQDEAFIFSLNLCALINYAPGTTNDWIIKGPLAIGEMFPFLRGTVFESGVDAAFESSRVDEAYLFKDDKYALINYNDGRLVSNVKLITDGYPSLKNTIFESGFDAAFASHRTDEAYLFKGDSYALINFAPGTTDDYIIGGVKPILPNWPSLQTILPRKNRGLDVHHHSLPQKDRDHDDP